MKLRYGLGDGYAYTLDETARIFKVTRERIRQVESKAIGKMHTTLNATPIVIELKTRMAEEASGTQNERPSGTASEVATEEDHHAPDGGWTAKDFARTASW